MSFISLSGLDLSFLHAPAGNVHHLPKPPKRRRKAKAKRRTKRQTAKIIDLAEVRKAKGLKTKKVPAKVAAKIQVSPKASAKVKRLAKDLGVKLRKPTLKSKRRKLH